MPPSRVILTPFADRLAAQRAAAQQQVVASGGDMLAVYRGAQNIVHNVYLTSHEGASAHTIRRLGIKAVINCTTNLPHHHVDGVAYYRVPVEDSFTQMVSHYFEPVAAIIRGFVLKGYSVLIHCQAGVSRSASCLLAYMISHHNLSLREAFQLMKRRRPLIEPNAFFMEQLVNYERLYRGAPSVHLTYSTTTSSSGGGGSSLPHADVLHDDPQALPADTVRQLEERAARLPCAAQPVARLTSTTNVVSTNRTRTPTSLASDASPTRARRQTYSAPKSTRIWR